MLKQLASLVLTLIVANLVTGSVEARTSVTMRASWYGPKFHGKTMANGAQFNKRDPTIAAHRSLPFGKKLRLINPANGRELTVVIRDRGPFVKGRQLDVSEAAAEILGFKSRGVAMLLVVILQ